MTSALASRVPGVRVAVAHRNARNMVYKRGPVPKCSYYWRCPAAVNWQDECTFEGWVGTFPSAVPPELRGTGGNMQACGGILPLPSWQHPSSAASVDVGALPS